MSDSIEKQIANCEERLKDAMVRSDLAALNDLLADELIFTSHLGQPFTKSDDLAAHKSGYVKVRAVDLSLERILPVGDIVVVSAKVHIKGSFAGVDSEADFRFTRIWRRSGASPWQVIAGHSSLIA